MSMNEYFLHDRVVGVLVRGERYDRPDQFLHNPLYASWKEQTASLGQNHDILVGRGADKVDYYFAQQSGLYTISKSGKYTPILYDQYADAGLYYMYGIGVSHGIEARHGGITIINHDGGEYMVPMSDKSTEYNDQFRTELKSVYNTVSKWAPINRLIPLPEGEVRVYSVQVDFRAMDYIRESTIIGFSINTSGTRYWFVLGSPYFAPGLNGIRYDIMADIIFEYAYKRTNTGGTELAIDLLDLL